MSILTEKPTLFVIARRHDELKKYGETFQIRNGQTNEVRKKVPALGIRDIIICGNITLHADIFELAEKNHIPIHFLSNGGKYRASTVFDFSKNVFLRSNQFRLHENKEERLKLAKKFVEAKASNQNTFLQKIRAKERLNIDIQNTFSLDQLRGNEGALARKYFMIWQKEKLIKHEGYNFSGRQKRPATDPINALLSFCFSLLHNEIHTQLLIAGLDPFVGFLHDQTFGHPALASDFIEIFRGPVEHFVLKSINRKEFDPKEDFQEETGGSVHLSRSGFQKFFPKWSDFLRTDIIQDERNLTRVIERDVRKFVHFLMKDEETFIPFNWRK